jgi:SAM-dependent methyltransferase
LMSALTQAVKNYWDRQPCGVKASSAPVGSATWSQQLTARRYFVESHVRDFAEFDTPRWRGKNVLEIGCGLGSDTLEFLKAGAFVHALDVSPRSIELAKGRCKAFKFDVKFYCEDAQDLVPWKNVPHFDLAWSFGVIHHVEHPAQILNNMRSALKDDGELRIMLYARRSLKFLLRERPEAQAGCPLVNWYSAREARRLVESAGFEVVSVEKTHIFPWKIKDYVQHRYVKRWPYRLMGERFFRWLEKRAGHHLLVIARKKRNTIHFKTDGYEKLNHGVSA